MQSTDRKPSLRRSAAIFAVILLGFVALGAYLGQQFGLFGRTATAPPEQPGVVHDGSKIIVPQGSALRNQLTIAPVVSEPLSAKLVLPGIVEADPARTAAVLPPLGGRIVQLNAALGDRVKKGQVLAVIDSPELAQALDDDDKAKAALDLTEKSLKRAEGSVKAGGGTVRDLDQAKNDNAQAAAEYRRTQARLQVLGAAGDMQRGERMLQVRAPIDGSVTALSIAPGNMINDPTQPIMTISDLGTVWVTAMVPEKDVAAIAKDHDVEVVLTAYPDQVLRGKVLFVSDVIEPDTRRDKIRIAFTNPDYKLRPNMFATVTAMGPARSRVVVPTSALLMNNDRTSVFVATAPWTFERRNVVPQLEEGSTVTISSGLAAGEQVVVKGGILLND